MKNRYQKTFETLKKLKRIAFCPFAVIGDPDEKGTLERIKKYLESGADMLELGIPFSDPIADGPVIQAASERALTAGMTPKKAIRLIAKIRALIEKNHRPNFPIGILTYANLAHHYGIEKFYRDLRKAGADSLLLADVPLEEIKPFVKAARKNHLAQICIVSENTARERLKKIEKIASGYLYVVSALGVTGARKNLPAAFPSFLKNLKKTTHLPLMVGFGISRPNQIKTLKKAGADGVIIGSRLIQTPLSKLYDATVSLRLQ